MTSRRAFLGTMGAAIAGAKLARGTGLGWAAPAPQRTFKGPFGIQLYSLRRQLDKDVPVLFCRTPPFFVKVYSINHGATWR